MVFGNRYRAELLAALADAGEHGVCLSELAASSGAPVSAYHVQMRALVEQELVEKLPVVIGERRRHYRRRGDGALWGALAGVVAALGEAGSGTAAAAKDSQGRLSGERMNRAR